MTHFSAKSVKIADLSQSNMTKPLKYNRQSELKLDQEFAFITLYDNIFL